MRKKPLSDIQTILKKMGLTEPEAMIFFKHFATRFINEECYMNLEVSSSNEVADGKEYANIAINTTIMVEEIPLLIAEDSCTILLGDAVTLQLKLPPQ